MREQQSGLRLVTAASSPNVKNHLFMSYHQKCSGSAPHNDDRSVVVVALGKSFLSFLYVGYYLSQTESPIQLLSFQMD